MPTPLLDNRQLGPDTARANLVTNGSMEIWQRGAGPFTATTAYTADRWQIGLSGGDTLSVSQNSANADSGGLCAACTFGLSAGAGTSGLTQKIENYNQFLGKTVSLSVRVRPSAVGAARAGIHDSVNGWRYGTASVQTAGYETITLTAPISASATQVNVGVFFAASSTVYVDNAMLVVGSQAADYAPLHPADDLARCLRYYETMDTGTGEFILSGMATAGGQNIRTNYFFKARKAVAPTITRIGTWLLQNATVQPAVSAYGLNSCYWAVQSTAAGDTYAYPWGAGLGMTIEANP